MNRGICKTIGWLVACVLLLNVALFAYVRHEHTVYSWDYDCYWGICGRFEQYYMTSTHVKFIHDVLGSIRDQEYTAEPVVPAAVTIALGEKLHLFSFSRTAYIMANGNLYLVPSLLLLVWLVSILKSNQFSLNFGSIQPAAWFAGGLIALLAPALWLPLLRGYPDAGGLLFCFLVMALFVRWQQKQRPMIDEVLAWLAIAILLVGLVYFRRWYLYWILWFWISAGMLCLWDAFEQWRGGLRWPAILRRAAVPGAGACAFAALLFVVSPRFVRELFSYNFADHYSDFRMSKTLWQFLGNTFSSPGIVFILLFIGGLACGFSIPHLRKLVVFQVVQFAGAVADFGHTQDLGPQHHYLLLAMMLPWATLFVAVGLQKFQWRFATCLMPVGVLTTILSFTPLSRAMPAALKPLIGAVDGAPLTRSDLAEWRRFGETMDSILLSDGYGQVYVLGASTTINSSAVLALNRSLNQNFKTPDFTDYSSAFDKIAGFPIELLHARYVIVASPVQIQPIFNPANQQIIAAPAREFLEGSGIAAAFEKLPCQFIFDGGIMYTFEGGVKVDKSSVGVKVFIFRKVRNITKEEVEQLSEKLRQAHPDRPYIYNPPPDIN